ncbi:MAG: polysaccharide pyruvyl transferase family protein [Pseudohaliea sp.]
MLKRFKEALYWRYSESLEPTIDLYGSVPKFVQYHRQLRTRISNNPVVYIYANRRNIGDYLSFRGAKEIVGLNGGELYCANAWSRHMPSYLSLCRERNIVAIVGGGGLLQPAFEHFWGQLLNSNIKFILIGIGINTMPGRAALPQHLVSKIARSAMWCGVRDKFTQSELGAYRVNPVRLGICPSVNFIHSMGSFSAKRSNTLLHIVHGPDLRMAGADVGKIRDNLIKFCSASGLVYRQSDNMGTNYRSAVRQISSAAIVVSSRLHGCIIALATNTPFIPLICDEKMRFFLDTHTNFSGSDPVDFHQQRLVEEACAAKMTYDTPVATHGIAEKVRYNYRLGKEIENIIVELHDDR